jgi:3-dehydroquinate dehydratase-2
MKIQIIHGPNLNLLGSREPDVYGSMTLDELDRRIGEHARGLGFEVRSAQANGEGELVELIHEAGAWADAIIINPAAYTHTSVAVRDAIAGVTPPAISVHLSNPSAREWFRHVDIVGGACIGVISGFGWRSYLMAMDALAESRPGD